jgi:menaquinone-9 beta-reductase
MIPTFYDLIIVGAGPAGCTAALSMAGSGLKIALVEKSKNSEKKICGDALSGTAVNVLKRLPGNCYQEFLDIPSKIPSWGIRFYAPSEEILDVPFVLTKTSETQVPGYICSREIFDGFLQQMVRKSGDIEFITNYNVKEITRKKEGFSLTGENDEMRCRMVLGTDGNNSTVGRILGGRSLNHKQYSLGVRTYFSGVKDLHPENFIELHFLEKLLPGYLWIFPMENGISNVGLGVLYDKIKVAPESLSAMLQKIIKTHPAISSRFKDSEMIGKIEAHGLPLGPDNRKISGAGFLLAGDAASLVDPFSGEGVGNAMVSGEIAANRIREAVKQNNFTEDFLSEYDTRIRNKMWNELKTSQRIQELCRYPSLFNLVVRKANRNKELKELLSKMYTNQNIRDQLKSPGFYLRMLLA